MAWDKLGKIISDGADRATAAYTGQYNSIKSSIQSAPERILPKSNIQWISTATQTI
jgi:hypothetical protein